MSEQEPETPEDVGEAFERAYRHEATAAPLWGRLERWGLALGGVTTLLTLLAWDLELSLGWALGILGGILNVSGLRHLVGWLLAAGGNGAMLIGALILKMTLLLVGIWAALRALPASPVAFAVGYGLAMAGLVVGSVILARRKKTAVSSGEGSQGES